tara:strand:+ start:704 stop:3658 length:2955 start_codon:yes stop_codon:yes gene_type:complete
MPENEFEKNNQELNKSNKTQAEINKKIKEGASLSKSMQDTLKKQSDTLSKSEKTLKGMNSATKALNTEYQKLGKESKAESQEGARQYKQRFKLNKAFRDQVGFAHKSADVAKMASDSLGLQNAYQKKFQLSLALTRERFQDNQNAALTTVNTLNDMREASKGLTEEQLLRAQGTNKLLKYDARLVENAGKIYERTARSGKVTKTFSQGYKDLVDSSMGVRQSAIDTAKAYDEIGKDTFETVSVDAERAKIQEKIASIGRKYFGANKAFGEDLQKQYEAQLDSLDATEAQNDRMKVLQKQTQSAAKFITGPFEKLDGILRALPAGDLIAEVVGVNQAMDDFSESVRTNLTAALDSKNFTDTDQAVKAIGSSAAEAADKLLTGFGNAFKLIASNPFVFMLATIIAAVGAMKMFYGGTLETRKELGTTVSDSIQLQHTLNKTAMSFKLMGVSAEDVKGISDGIMDNMGGVSEVTEDTVMGFAELNAHFGIAGEQAVQLAVALESVGAASTQAAQSQLESIGHLARQNGVAPAKIMSDMASDMEFFSSFAQQGGGNIAKAAISARKLGLNMASVSKMSESLLSFEESINAQMEAQVLTGKNINTDKARQMALAGDLDGMQREITKQVGTQEEFERMNVVQRQALAQAFGVSVQDLSKMVANQDKLNKMTDSQKKRQNLIADIMEQIGRAGTELMGAFKALIPLAIGILTPIIAIAGVITGLLVGLGKIIGFMNELNFLGVGLGDVMMFAAGAALLFKGNLFGGMASGFKKLTGGISSVASKLKGGGAADAVSKGGGAGEALAKGGKGMGAGLKGLSKGVSAFANPKVALGLAAVTVSLIGMGFALKLAAPGIKAFGEAMGTIIGSVASGISTIIGAVGDFAVKLMTIASPTMALGLFATAAGFTALAGSMAMFAGAGLLALPALLALTAFNAVTGAGGGGGGENTTDTLLKEQITELKKMNAKLDMVTSNTKKGADEARSLNSSVIMA